MILITNKQTSFIRSHESGFGFHRPSSKVPSTWTRTLFVSSVPTYFLRSSVSSSSLSWCSRSHLISLSSCRYFRSMNRFWWAIWGKLSETRRNMARMNQRPGIQKVISAYYKREGNAFDNYHICSPTSSSRVWCTVLSFLKNTLCGRPHRGRLACVWPRDWSIIQFWKVSVFVSTQHDYFLCLTHLLTHPKTCRTRLFTRGYRISCSFWDKR